MGRREYEGKGAVCGVTDFEMQSARQEGHVCPYRDSALISGNVILKGQNRVLEMDMYREWRIISGWMEMKTENEFTVDITQDSLPAGQGFPRNFAANFGGFSGL